jgi:type I restriction enzyme S subunit
MAKFKLVPYPHYQESSHKWLGHVPAHWNILPHRTLFLEKKDRGVPQEELLSVSISKGITKQSDLLRNSSKKDSSNEDKSKYKLVIPNDIVFNKMRAWQGAIGVSKYRGIVSPAYIVHRLRDNNEPWFFHYLFRTPYFAKEAERWSYGITSDQWSLRAEDFKCIYSCVPPLEEQQKIVNFIQQQDRRIRKLIKNKKRLIDLLEQEFQMASEHLIKFGLYSKEALVKTNCEYLPFIPKNWKLVKMKRIARFNPTKNEFVNTPEDQKVVFLPMEKISVNGTIDCSECLPYGQLKKGYTYFAKNDVVVAKITPCFENGKGAFLDKLETAFGFGTTELIVMRPSQEIHGVYLRQLTNTRSFLQEAAGYMQGSAGQKRIPDNFIKNRLVAIPPYEEQLKLLEILDDRRKKHESVISKARTEINLIQEFLTRLITDAVTGKIDLRSIPIEPTEESPEEDLSYLSENGFDADAEIGADEDELLEEAVHAN